MKKKLVSITVILSILLSLVCALPVSAYTGTQYGEYLYYEINNGEVTITDCNESVSGDLIIPDTIEGLPVTTIGEKAFFGCRNFTYVDLSSSITSIGKAAFLNCNISAITIPKNIISIGDNAFGDCNNLKNIQVDIENLFFSSDENGVLFNKDKTVLLQYPSGKENTTINIPNGVTTIKSYAFENIDIITEIKIPNSVMSIEDFAFWGCSGINTVKYSGNQSQWNNIVIGFSNESLTDATIYYTESTTPSVTIEKNGTCGDNLTWTLDSEGTLTISGTGAMENWNYPDHSSWYDISDRIKSVIIEKGVTSIGSSAFENCSSLTSIRASAGLTQINPKAFYKCTGLTSVTLPNTLTSIAYEAFCNCVALESVTIPSATRCIAMEAFAGCRGLTSITISVGTIKIEDGAFYDCGSLADVYYCGSKEDWEKIEIEDWNECLTGATIHFAPLPMTMATVEMTESADGTKRNFIVDAADKYANCYVYAGIYDENSKLLSIARVPLDTDGSTSLEVNKSDKDFMAKVFVWANTMQPIITAWEKEL